MDNLANWQWGSIITAVSTCGLFIATIALVIFTALLAKKSSQAQIVVTIEPNRWSSIHLNYQVENVGNAPAYDICVTFNPPLHLKRENNEEIALPFSNMNILKPGAPLTTYLGAYSEYSDLETQCTISWSLKPRGKKRETLSYAVDLKHLENTVILGDGGGDPAIAFHREFKKFSADARKIFSGNKRLKTDVFTQAERNEEYEQARQRNEAFRARLSKEE